MKPPSHNSTEDTVQQQPRIAALYARVSTERQEDEQTIQVQIAELKERIAADGNVLSDKNIFTDDGWSGAMLQRPALDNMRAAAANGSFEVLYVFDRGRLARKYHYQAIVIEQLEDRGIVFISLKDKSVVTDDDRVWQGFQGLFAEWERAKIAERFRIGRIQRAKAGRLINGQSLYGYTRIKRGEKQPAYIIINEEEARVVRMIFEWYGSEKCSLREIIQRLYRLGIPPRKEKSDRWTKGPLIRILKCESYFTGEIYYNKSEAVVPKNPISKEKYKRVKKSSRKERPREEWLPYSVPKLIEDTTIYAKVQKRLEYNKRYATKNKKHDYLLSGFVWCECGHRRAGDGYSKGNNHYYRCAQRIYKHPKPSECTSPGINAVVVDKAFWHKFSEFLKDPKLSREAAENYLKETNVDSVTKQQQLRLQQILDNLGEEEKRYLKAYGTGTMSEQQFQEMAEDVSRRRLPHQRQLNALRIQERQRQVDPISVEKLMEKVALKLKKIDPSEKREVIEDVISKVCIGRNTVDVYGKVEIPSSSLCLNMGLKNENRNRRPA
ncbi:MAG: recombinase family protein [Candidatus Andersenbacteria bacterium]